MKNKPHIIFMNSLVIIFGVITLIVMLCFWMYQASNTEAECSPTQAQSNIMGRFNSLEIRLNDHYNSIQNRFDEIYQCKEFLKDNK